ncbi:hypothetical protein ES705_13806 [subsurface metagenome]
MNSNKEEKLSFLEFIYVCKATNPKLSTIPQGTMLPSLIFSILGLFLGRITELLQISISQEFLILFLLIYILFLLLQILASTLYISAKGVLRKYFAGDILNLFSSFGIYTVFFLYIWVIILQVINGLYAFLLILANFIMILIFYMQSIKPLIQTKGLLKRMYEQCTEYGSFPDCKTCKMLGR